MPNPVAVAGRHGSFGTYFSRPASIESRWKFSTRGAMRAAVSLKALERRLVLPLEENNWRRALEVLSAGYAKLSRTPDHVQRVVRSMRLAASESTAERAAVTEALDTIRADAFAGDVPSNGSLYMTLLWAYCELDRPEEAVECLHQCLRRSLWSPASREQAVGLLMPLLARTGLLQEAEQVLEVTGVSKARFREELAAAAAARGSWKSVQQYLSPSGADLSHSGPSVSQQLPSQFSRFPVSALRALLSQSWTAEPLTVSSALWHEVYHVRQTVLSHEDFHCLLNALGASSESSRTEQERRQHWDELLYWFAAVYLSPAEAEVFASRCSSPLMFTVPASVKSGGADLPLTPAAMNMVFCSFPLLTGSEEEFLPHHVAQPEEMIRLFDMVLMQRDDATVTNHVASRVCCALLQRRDSLRALQVLKECSLLRPIASPATQAARRLQRELIILVYLTHRSLIAEGKSEVMEAFPHLFPQDKPSDVAPPAPAPRQRPPRRPIGTNKDDLTDESEYAMALKGAYLRGQHPTPFAGPASRDPRPAPRGLHDTASGWNAYGRGGEMVFFNNRRIAHPFSMNPKVMRARVNPYRSWRVHLNSSLAHREGVVKWNGKSGV